MSEFTLAIIAIVVVVAGISLYLISRTGSGADVSGYYTQGLNYMLAGNLKKAYDCFKQVIEKDTENNSAYLKLGQVLREGGQPEKALQLHESLLARIDLKKFEQEELSKDLALDYADMGRYDKAIEYCLAILKADKKSSWALRKLVKFHGANKDWVSAGKYLAQLLKLSKREDSRLLAFCRFRQGHDHRDTFTVEEVREHYLKALKVDSGFAPAHYFLAESFAEEAKEYKELLSVGDAVDKSQTKKQKNASDQAQRLLTQAISHWTSFVDCAPSETARVLQDVEDTLYFLQRFDDLEPFLRNALNKDPNNAEIIASLANFYVRKGEISQAELLLSGISDKSESAPLIAIIQLKMDYRRDPEQNLISDLDNIINLIRARGNNRSRYRETPGSLMNWLDPLYDPLEKLA